MAAESLQDSVGVNDSSNQETILIQILQESSQEIQRKFRERQ